MLLFEGNLVPTFIKEQMTLQDEHGLTDSHTMDRRVAN